MGNVLVYYVHEQNNNKFCSNIVCKVCLNECYLEFAPNCMTWITWEVILVLLTFPYWLKMTESYQIINIIANEGIIIFFWISLRINQYSLLLCSDDTLILNVI